MKWESLDRDSKLPVFFYSHKILSNLGKPKEYVPWPRKTVFFSQLGCHEFGICLAFPLCICSTNLATPWVKPFVLTLTWVGLFWKFSWIFSLLLCCMWTGVVDLWLVNVDFAASWLFTLSLICWLRCLNVLIREISWMVKCWSLHPSRQGDVN